MEKDFIKKYEDSLFEIELYIRGDLWEFLVYADGKSLSQLDEEYFWTLYPEMETIKEIKGKELVKFKK